MSELIEYFSRHYTLVLDNDHGSYDACIEATRTAILSEMPDLTLPEYLAMTDKDREATFAYPIGAAILEIIEESIDDQIGEAGTLGALLIKEIIMTDGSDLAYALGSHYMPEKDDASFLPGE